MHDWIGRPMRLAKRRPGRSNRCLVEGDALRDCPTISATLRPSAPMLESP
jgi:hypothetical protein